MKGWIMRGSDLESMSIDDLWALHERVTLVLGQKLEAEKAKLAQRLSQLQKAPDAPGVYRARRTYPPVAPKYRNPINPAEVWSGRGKRPRWLEPQIQAGKGLDDFLIDPALPSQ
jgi:DNA-binding protein H-NS